VIDSLKDKKVRVLENKDFDYKHIGADK